jgi:hypothetical protein
MPAKKYVALSSGEFAEIAGTVASTGSADDGKLVSLDSSGRIDPSMMPVGVSADTKTLTASEALVAGNLVNIELTTGQVRKADASNGREADGFVIASFASAAAATVYFEGTVTGLSGLTPGAKLYLGTAGGVTATPPTTAGHISQRVGKATSATEVTFEPQRTVTLA